LHHRPHPKHFITFARWSS
ncbi:hypothetical protein PF005_g32303, partial [Phytophthora fragariae]